MKPTSKQKILVIDDDTEILGMLRTVFSENGYSGFGAASDYPSALERLERRDWDLIICDIMLGEKTGIDILDAMARRKIKTPVILITGKPDLETAIEALRRGAFDYIRKPIRVKPLLETVAKALLQGRREQQDRNAYAEQMNAELESYRLHLERLRQQIDSAVDVYRHLVALQEIRHPLEIRWRHRPLADLGGDFIDIRETGDRIDLIVADVAGHDIGSSFYTILLKAFFEENCWQGNDGETLFRLLNQHLLESGKDDRMVTALFCRVFLPDLRVELVSAAHPWLLLLKSGAAEIGRPLQGGSDVLGIHEDPGFMGAHLQLAPGDRLLLHTDGLANAAALDSRSGAKRRMDPQTLDRLIRQHRSSSLEGMIDGVWRGVMAFCNHLPKDDMALVGVEIPERNQ